MAPAFERSIEQPVAGVDRRCRPTAGLVVTEGNYLLLDEPRWRAVAEQLDAVWHVSRRRRRCGSSGWSRGTSSSARRPTRPGPGWTGSTSPTPSSSRPPPPAPTSSSTSRTAAGGEPALPVLAGPVRPQSHSAAVVQGDRQATVRWRSPGARRTGCRPAATAAAGCRCPGRRRPRGPKVRSRMPSLRGKVSAASGPETNSQNGSKSAYAARSGVVVVGGGVVHVGGDPDDVADAVPLERGEHAGELRLAPHRRAVDRRCDGPSRSSSQFEGIDRGRSAEITFQVARERDHLTRSATRSCSGPRMPWLAGPVEGVVGAAVGAHVEARTGRGAAPRGTRR